jgi:hypothetical protein
MESSLLCTFSHAADIKIIADYISQNYRLERQKIFVFHNADDPTEVYYTYNVLNADHFIENTILIHRKKDTNTLYTINALNTIIRNANNGVLDKTFVVEWENYSNSLLITISNDVRVIPLILKTIIKK